MMPRPTQASHVFDYTDHLDKLIRHIISTSPQYAHINHDRLLVAFGQARSEAQHGVFATIQALRFAGGHECMERGKRTHRWPRVMHGDREILYLIQFMMPRFADLEYRQKLTTVFHELYHVSPDCNGDLRRFPGRNFAHGVSRDVYNARLQPWIDEYLSHPDSAEVTSFLRLTFNQVQAQFGQVVGIRARPLRPVATGLSADQIHKG